MATEGTWERPLAVRAGSYGRGPCLNASAASLDNTCMWVAGYEPMFQVTSLAFTLQRLTRDVSQERASPQLADFFSQKRASAHLLRANLFSSRFQKSNGG